jgi:MFS transporter, SHS family, sialic acid transporter
MSELASPNKTITRGQWMTLLAAFLGWMFDGLEMGIFPLVEFAALQDFKVPHDQHGFWQAIFRSAFLLGAAAGGLLFGWLGDKIGRVKAMTYSVLAYSLFTGIGYVATNPEQLVVLRFIASLGMGGEWALGVALVMECWPSGSRPLLAGLIGAASNVGFGLIAAIAIKFQISEDSWRWVMLAGAAPALLTTFIRMFVPESEKWQKSQEEAPREKRKSTLSEIFAPGLRKNTLLGITFASVALVGTWGSVQWIPSWVASELNPTDKSAKAVAQLVSAFGAVVGCIVAPLIGDKLGRRPTYCLMCLMSLGVCGALYGLTTTYDNQFLIMVFLVGCITASFYGWLPLYLPELFPTRVRATGQGLAFNFGRILAAGGAMFVGTLKDYHGGSFAKAGMTITFVYLVGVAVIWFAPETKGKPLPE